MSGWKPLEMETGPLRDSQGHFRIDSYNPPEPIIRGITLRGPIGPPHLSLDGVINFQVDVVRLPLAVPYRATPKWPHIGLTRQGFPIYYVTSDIPDVGSVPDMLAVAPHDRADIVLGRYLWKTLQLRVEVDFKRKRFRSTDDSSRPQEFFLIQQL